MSDPTVLFLPGMMLDGEMFAPQIAALTRHRSVIGDLSAFDSVENLAREVLRCVPGKFACVGLSMGGIVAIEMYRIAADRFTHLALLDTTPYADRPERRAQRAKQLTAVGEGALAEVLQQSMLPQYFSKRAAANGQLRQSVLSTGLALGPDVFRRQTHALRDRRDNFAVLGQIRCPALVLCGREDRLCAPEIHHRMAEAIPGADLIMLADAGHITPLEAPGRVGRALEALLERPS